MQKPLDKIEFEATGTQWQIQVSQKSEGLTELIQSRIRSFEAVFSRFDKTSVLSKLAEGVGSYTATDTELLDFYTQMYDVSSGIITPAIGKNLEEAGYDQSYSFTPKALSNLEDWTKIISWEKNKISNSSPIRLDVGAAGKGRLIDILFDLLIHEEVGSFTINAGGDIRTNNFEMAIGLENPFDHSQIIGKVNLKNGALCASSGSRRSWGTFTHIINPLTKSSPSDVAATWVRASTAMRADGIATSLFMVDPETLASKFDFEYAILQSDNKLRMSPNFGAQLY